eukprot:Tamp_13239.p1 GENE.Tamp_13239~~Tamp_13239.p1  ORF type:complete len:512 (+),score=35.12 Tamp_13239:24-1559(+)
MATRHERSLQELAAGHVGRRVDRDRVFPHCAACKQPLQAERVVLNSAGGAQSFHPHCLKCHECRHPLGTQPFLVTEGLRFHRACLFCHEPGCGIPLADVGHFRHGGRNLCRTHYENVALPRCIRCNQPLRGEFVTFAQKSELPGLSPRQSKQLQRRGSPTTTARPTDGMCRNCFRCAECKHELMGKKFFEHEGRPYCEADYEQLFAPKCKSCARALWGSFRVHESGETYCIPCTKHEPSCFSCGRLVWARRAKYEVHHPVDLPDGRVACELCVKDSVFSPVKAEECFTAARHFVQWLLGREVSFAQHLRAKVEEIGVSGRDMWTIPLTLVDRTEMSTLCFEHGMHKSDCPAHQTPTGITLLQKEVFGCARDTTALGTTRLHKRPPTMAGAVSARTVTRAVKGICALNALPPVVLTSTLVHELLHYHMFVVGKFRPNPPEVEEGVCELAALLYLRSLPQSDERDMRIRQRLESPSKVYGGGLRSAEQKWRQLGGDRQAFNRVLEHVRVHQSF